MYVVITGASRGIGRELAKEIAKRGYDLILTCKNNFDKLNELQDEINRKVILIKGNIYDNDLPEDIKKDTYMIINNQGIADYNLLQDIDIKTYNNMIDSNLTNAIFTTKYFLPYMIKKKEGKIVNISSVWGEVGASCEVLYSATKGAINSFTKALAKELLPSKIDVVAYSLGIVDTDMCKGLDIDGIIKDNPKDIANKIVNSIISNNYHSGDIISLNNGLI